MDEGKMDENEWGYHGEGNKSLVVAHAQRCVVLRFLKFPPNRKKTSEEIFQHLQNIVDFGKNVMKEFLGENYVHCGPKCGFIPFSSDVTHEMKHKVCRYCMHQHLK
ncbi:Inositol-pentakisphosphate 2-kinase, partial [Camelus dromedarius]